MPAPELVYVVNCIRCYFIETRRSIPPSQKVLLGRWMGGVGNVMPYNHGYSEPSTKRHDIHDCHSRKRWSASCTIHNARENRFIDDPSSQAAIYVHDVLLDSALVDQSFSAHVLQQAVKECSGLYEVVVDRGCLLHFDVAYVRPLKLHGLYALEASVLSRS
jgi:hypothetical protein